MSQHFSRATAMANVQALESAHHFHEVQHVLLKLSGADMWYIFFFIPEDTTNNSCFKLHSNKRNLTPLMFVINYVTYISYISSSNLNLLAIIGGMQFRSDFTSL